MPENGTHGSIGGRWGSDHDHDRDGRETFGPAPDVVRPSDRTSGLPHRLNACELRAAFPVEKRLLLGKRRFSTPHDPNPKRHFL